MAKFKKSSWRKELIKDVDLISIFDEEDGHFILCKPCSEVNSKHMRVNARHPYLPCRWHGHIKTKKHIKNVDKAQVKSGIHTLVSSFFAGIQNDPNIATVPRIQASIAQDRGTPNPNDSNQCDTPVHHSNINMDNTKNLSTYTMPWTSIEDAIIALRDGKFVVVMDNEDRENEGDLIMPASMATEASLAFMTRYCSGVICAAASPEIIDRLELPLMVSTNTEARQCKFTVSVDVKLGTSTGISAADRAATIRALASHTSVASDFNRPGHVFPLVAVKGGVLSRAGHTEAAVDLALLAGCPPVGYLCELNDDMGRMMRREQLETFANLHQLPLITISDLISYRSMHETLVMTISPPTSTLTTPHGTFNWLRMKSECDASRMTEILMMRPRSWNIPVLVHIVQEGLMGMVESQWAQMKMARVGQGIILSLQADDSMVNVSGHVMAQQARYALILQMLRSLNVPAISFLTTQSSSPLPNFHSSTKPIILASTHMNSP